MHMIPLVRTLNPFNYCKSESLIVDFASDVSYQPAMIHSKPYGLLVLDTEINDETLQKAACALAIVAPVSNASTEASCKLRA